MKPVRFLASEFCRAGYAVCAIDYRLIFRGGDLEKALDDVLAALVWWEKQTHSYKLDATRIHLCGISAGATLACLAAAKPQAAFLQSLVCFFGLYDFAALRGPLAKLFERTLVKNDDWTRHAPMQQELAPIPTLLLHGDADTLVYHEQAQAFAALRQSQGLATKLKTYARQPHGFMNHVTPVSKEVLEEVLGFLGSGD